MKHPAKRFLALFLVLIFCISLFPAAALAEEPEEPAEEPAPAEEPVEEPGPGEEPDEPTPAEEPDEPTPATEPAEDPAPAPGEEPEAEPAPADEETGDRSFSVTLTVEVYDANYQPLTGVEAGTASYLPANPRPGDTVYVTATPAAGYQLQYVYYDDGVRMGYDATRDMRFTIPADYCSLELFVCFTPAGTSLPLPGAGSLLLELPQPGVSYSGPVPGQVLNAAGHWYDVDSVYWYGGTGSGCEGQPPTSFLLGHKYYPEIVLTPHAHWHWREDTSTLLLYHDPASAEPTSWEFSGGSTGTLDSEGRLHLTGREITLPGDVRLRIFNYACEKDGAVLDLDGGTVKLSVNGDTPVEAEELMVCAGDTISISAEPENGFALRSAKWGNGDDLLGDVTDSLSFTIPSEGGYFELVVYFVRAGEPVTLKIWETEMDEMGVYQHGSKVGVEMISVNGSSFTEVDETEVCTGDVIRVYAEPYQGYQVQQVLWSNGAAVLGIITDTMEFTIPDDLTYCELDVFYSPAGAELPVDSVSFDLPLPVPGVSYEAGISDPIPTGFEQFDVLWYTWYGGTGSGCQGEKPTSFIEGASYYAWVALAPKEHWRFTEETRANVLLDTGVWLDEPAVSYFPDSGGIVVQIPEQTISTKTITAAALEVEMFEEGGEYPTGCPVVFELPENAPFTVSDAIWYNYANQESGGIGLAAGFFTREGRYFTEFDLIPNEGYVFTADTQIELTNGSVEIKTLNSDGSLHVVTSWFSLDPEAAAQYRRVFVTNYVANADGSTNISGFGGYVLPSDSSPKVGDTLIFGVMPQNGYRLQWLTVARHSEWIGDDITDTLEFYVDDEPGDVYVNAMFALADEPVTCRQVNLNVELPLPGGNYSGYAPATVTPFAANASEYTVQSARWYEQQTGGVGTPSSFVPGQEYCVEIVVAPDPKWSFADNVEAMLYLSDGSYMSSWSGDVGVYKLDNGNLCLTSGFLTLPEAAIDSVELSLDLPEEGDSFEFMSQPWATFYTPHVGEMYTLWKNGADQATGAKGEQTSSFQPGCVYYATIRIIADPGYYLTADTRVTLRNGLSFTTSYSTTDRSLWIDTESITIPTESYQLSGTYVKFRINDVETTTARPGQYVVVRSDITTQPLGTYLASVTSEDVELTQITEITWGFTMPAKNVRVIGELLPQETYVFELEDGVHEMNARDALWLFGEYEAGTMITRDLDGDGQDDIRVEFRADGTAQVIRLGSIFGEITIQTPSGRIGTIVYRFGPERYSLWLGSVQVDAENKSNIPVLGGRASYDPDTKTLTLTDYTGSIGVAAQGELYPSLTSLFSITSGGDLTVTGSGRLTDKTLHGGISCGGNLTLSGDFEIHAGYYGIYTNGNLTVYGNTAIYDTTQMGVDAIGDLRVLLGSLRVMTDEGIGVYSSGDVTVAGDLHSEAGEAGLQCSGNVTLMGGTIWADSLNDIGLLGGSDLYVQNGGFTAHGNIQALEVASISFDTATHFISLPVNGTVSDDDTTIIDPSTGDPARNAQITDKKPTVNLGVKDLDGSEGVGGWVGFGDGDLFRQTYNTVSYGTTLTICASPEEGYRFDHWEDAYGGSFTDESQNFEIQIGVYVDCAYFAVFEELLPINETNFPDENFRSYVAENCDPNGDGYLSWAERNAVTSIDVSSKSITSLVGLKYFPELTRLYCYSNPDLREVDVRQNKKILYVQCYSCSKLERLYITGCSELSDLRCYSCNLSAINFSGCTSLKMLQCYGNKLSGLNLSACHQLGRVDCQNNPNLSELDINSADLYILFSYGTKLNTLDVSACPRLFDTVMLGEFSQTSSYDRYDWKDGSTIKGDIRCNRGAEFESNLGIPINAVNFPDPLFRADVAKYFDSNQNGWLSPTEIANTTGFGFEDEDFASVQGIGFFTEMTSLLLDGAPRLTSIDLRSNTKLQYVDVCANQLYEIKLDGLTELVDLSVDNNRLTELDVSAFQLNELRVQINPMTSLTLGQQPNLNTLYAHWTDLEELDLSGCPLLLDAYLNGEQTVMENAERGNYIKYVGPLGGTLYLDADQVVATEPDMGIAINSENFPDPVFRQYVSQRFDLNHNGWLKPNEIEAATAVELEDDEGLESVQGIGFLTETTYILIDNAPNLTELDISGNGKLTGLEVWLTGLNRVTLGEHPELESIDLNNNALTSLSLDGVPNLTSLDLSYNPLFTVDLSGAPDLSWASLHDTNLATLDLTENPLLLDAYLNGTVTEYDGYVKYSGGPLGGTLYIDTDQVVVTEETPDHMPGDINGDGVVNNKDVLRLQKYLKDPTTTVNAAALDVNGDGKVNNKDLIRLTRWLKYHDVEIH